MAAQTKFIIFGQGRSGTTLLKQLIDSHPAITCDGELLNMKDGYITNKYFLKVAYRIPIPYFSLKASHTKTSCYGFTLLYHQCRNPNQLIKNLYHSGWKIINLCRDNTMEQVLSYLVAFQTNNWHSWQGKQSPVQKIHVDSDLFLQRVDMLTRVKENEQNLMQKYNHAKVNYESDLADETLWQSTADRIFGFLGLDSHPVVATLKKTYPKPYSEIIENYDDLIHMVEKY